jgi:hypothetical protein
MEHGILVSEEDDEDDEDGQPAVQLVTPDPIPAEGWSPSEPSVLSRKLARLYMDMYKYKEKSRGRHARHSNLGACLVVSGDSKRQQEPLRCGLKDSTNTPVHLVSLPAPVR